MTLRRFIGILAALLVSGLGATSAAAEAERAGATDAKCPWGRLGDGRGGFVRCLTAEEATHLLALARKDTPARPSPASAAEPAPAPPLAKSAPGGPDEAPPSPQPPARDVTPVPAPAPQPRPPAPVHVEIRPPVAETGSFPDAVKSLEKATDRLVACIDEHGGLAEPRGEVELRFLVRGRGRAEGIGVHKRRGVGARAAKCIADVIDRRFVGYPEEPIVAATLSIAFSKKAR